MAVITNTTLYDADFYARLNEQAALLRAGRLSELDVENLAGEIESMGRFRKARTRQPPPDTFTQLSGPDYRPDD
jgi:hypothetical protein